MKPFFFVLFAAGSILCPGAFPKSGEMSDGRKLEHALSRLAWGPAAGDAARVGRLGLRKWIDEQLHPDRIEENANLQTKLSSLASLHLDTETLFAQFRDRKTQPIRPILRETTEARVLRAVYTNRQLEDVLTDFWFNHFNVFLDKGADRVFVGPYERDAIRPHVLGKFGDLLEATASHPAMLWYLDNWQSVGENSAAATRPLRVQQGKPPRGLNENYARELLELHTLGVDGGYTQADVVAVARCFTGWTVRDGRFQFVPRMHDAGEKTVLGVRIPAGGGEEDGKKVLNILAHHPSTATFISRKLAQRFVSDEPPVQLVSAMAATFRKTHGDIREVMKTMLKSQDFWYAGLYRSRLKSPLELVISAARAANADLIDGGALAAEAAKLGQPIYRKLEPTGYSNTSAEWKNSASLLARMNLAGALAHNRVRGLDAHWPSDPLLILNGPPSSSLTAILEQRGAGDDALEAVLGSPDFQKK